MNIEITIGGVEEVDWVLSIGNNEALNSKSGEKLSLGFRSGSGDSNESVFANSTDELLEFLSLDFSQLSGLADFKFSESFLVLDLGFGFSLESFDF